MTETLELTNIKGLKKKLTILQQCFEREYTNAGNLRLHTATLKLLKNRGIRDAESIKNFLYPSLHHLHDPFMLKDMDIAVERIIQSIKRNEKIFVVGDYDTDGVTATSIMLKFFHEIGIDADFYIPTRDDGYGLSLDAIKKANERGAGLIITVDNGITSLDEIEFARIVGMDVIVTDHHEPQEELPKAYAVVNPKRKDSVFPFKELSGVGVAFNLLMALRSRLRREGFFNGFPEPNLKKYLDLVALGTLADIVPLMDENRICVKFGLQSSFHSCVGLDMLKKVSGINGNLTPKNINFSIAPRINAAGRLYDASIAVEMFMEDDEEKAMEMVQRLNDINNERKKLQSQIISEIEQNIAGAETPVIVASGKGWHRGVIGIAANSISYKYSKPVVIISEMENLSVGSGRSSVDIDLFSVIRETGDLLERFGGHKMAVGITIKSNLIDAFKERINEVVEKRYGASKKLTSHEVDCEVSLSIFDRGLLKEISRMEPFGAGNEEPLFLVKHALVKEKKLILEKYPKYLISDNTNDLWMISFDTSMNLKIGYMYDILFTAGVNNGYVSFSIKDAFLSNIRG